MGVLLAPSRVDDELGCCSMLPLVVVVDLLPAAAVDLEYSNGEVEVGKGSDNPSSSSSNIV